MDSFIKLLQSRNKCIADLIIILMDGRIKQSCRSIEAIPGQLCCFSQFFPSSLMFTCFFFFYRQQGNPHFFTEAIVISVWILGLARGGGRGTTRCPCWQRCIKMGMSHPICWAYITASKGGSSVPLFFPWLQSVPSLPHLLLLCFSPLLSLSMIWRWGIH